MGLTQSRTDLEIQNDYSRKLRLKKLQKQLRNKKIVKNETEVSTIDWITESTLNFTDSMKGGYSKSQNTESETLNKLNQFIRSLDTDSENSNNFEAYQKEVQNLEKYINQNGGFEKFEGRPLNIFFSEYLQKLKGGSAEEEDSDDDDELDELNDEMEDSEEDEDEGEDEDLDDDDSESEEKKTRRKTRRDRRRERETKKIREATKESGLTNNDIDEEIKFLAKYVRQHGGFKNFEGRFLNLSNSKILNNIKVNNQDEISENVSTINFTDKSEDNLFIKKVGGSRFSSNLSATSPMNGGGMSISKYALSQTSVSKQDSSTSPMIGGSMSISKYALSQTSDNTQMGGVQKVEDNETISATSVNSKINLNNLPRFSETSFSDTVLNGGGQKESSEDSSDKEIMRGSSSSETDSEEDLNDESSTESSDDTVVMARMIARQRAESEAASDESSSTTTEMSESSESEELDSDEDSETSDADTSTESSDAIKHRRKMERSKKTKKASKSKKSKKSKKSSRKYISDNTLTQSSQSTEFKAVPFYSSEHSTDFYRTYQIKNRFN